MFNFDKISNLLKNTKVPENMINRGLVGLKEFLNPMEELLNQKKPPEKGWSDNQIRFFLEIMANMDSNNDPEAYKIGEREGRISTPLLYELSGGFIHGIGRSGDIKASQPKAVGGSVLNNLTDSMITYFLKEMGLQNISGSLTVPLSTGMALMLSIRGLYNNYLKENAASDNQNQKNEILVPRLDHQSPIKAVALSGLKMVGIESRLGKEILKQPIDSKLKEFIQRYGTDSVYIDVSDIEKAINDKTVGILSTTTFFPPRAPDNIKEIAKLAKKHNLIHVINNAYGVQSPEIMKMIRSAIDSGRVDAIIQSTDKNFLTPIGGAIITSPYEKNIEIIAKSYAGRGSSAPILHLFVSLLSMGMQGYQELVKNQQENKAILEKELHEVAESVGEVVLDSYNPIACMMSLNRFNSNQIENLGGYLYNLRVTGPRVLDPNKENWGSCYEKYPVSYVVMNAAIGSTTQDIMGAISQLKKAISQVKIK